MICMFRQDVASRILVHTYLTHGSLGLCCGMTSCGENVQPEQYSQSSIDMAVEKCVGAGVVIT